MNNRLEKLNLEKQRFKLEAKKWFEKYEELQKEFQRSLSSWRHLKCISENVKLKSQISELEGWKESAISVMPDIQAIGKEMGLQTGQAISPKILPYIKELKEDRDWFMEAHNYLLKEAAEYSTKSEKRMIDLETEATDQKLKQESLVKEMNELKEDLDYYKSLCKE